MLLNAMVLIFGVVISCRKAEVEFLIKNQDKKEGVEIQLLRKK